MKTILFDLDGTLIHSAPDIHFAANRMLAELDLPALSLETVTSFIGNGVPKLVERVMRTRGIPTERHSELVETFLEIYNADPTRLTKPYPGVVASLSVLAQRGDRLGVCTNKPTAATLDILSRLDLASYFDVVICGDTLPVRKPDPAPLLEGFSQLGRGTPIYVGDSEIDAETAQRADVPFLLFEKGYRKQPLEKLVYRASFPDFHDLADLVVATETFKEV